MKEFVLPVEITSLSSLERKTKKAIYCVSTQMLEMVCKKMNAKINFVVTVNDGRIELDSTWLKLPEN